MNVAAVATVFGTIATICLLAEATWLFIRNRPAPWKQPKIEASKKKYVIIFPSYKDRVDIRKWLNWSKGTKTQFIIAEDIVRNEYPKDKRLTILRRETRSGFKAGALNHAFSAIKRWDFDYVLIFDADHIPEGKAETLFGVIEYYDFPVVQLFHNDGRPRNNFLGWLTFAGRQSSNWNIYNREFATNLTGSGMCFRKEIVNDFRFPMSMTEDYALSLKLYRARIPIEVIPISACYGKAPLNFKAFVRQQLRWSEGTISDAMRTGISLNSNFTDILDYLLHVNMYMQGFWIFVTLVALPFSNINPLFLVLVLLYQMTAFMYTLHTAPKKYWLGFLALNYPLMFVQIYALMRAITIKKDVFVRTRKAEENTLAR